MGEHLLATWGHQRWTNVTKGWHDLTGMELRCAALETVWHNSMNEIDTDPIRNVLRIALAGDKAWVMSRKGQEAPLPESFKKGLNSKGEEVTYQCAASEGEKKAPIQYDMVNRAITMTWNLKPDLQNQDTKRMYEEDIEDQIMRIVNKYKEIRTCMIQWEDMGPEEENANKKKVKY